MNFVLTGSYSYNGSTYTLNINLVTQNTANPDGSFTVTTGSGTDTIGDTTYQVSIDPVGTDSTTTGALNDNNVFLTSPYLSTNGLGINLYQIQDHADLYYTGNNQLLRDATGATAPLNVTISPVCFTTGTLIRTDREGVEVDLAVEALRVGDLAVTASGARRPIRWIGDCTLDCCRHPDPRAVWPVRVAAHAFGPGRPERDLYLSPQHAVAVTCLAEVLIPVRHLVNGATIAQVEVGEVSYWHVELDSHDILLAGGLPCESYLETSPRDAFFEGGAGRAAGHRATAVKGMDAFCRPLVETGPLLPAVRAQLARQAEALGWTISRDPGLHLMVNGRRVEPMIAGLVARFAVPAGAREVRLRSNTFVPRVFEHGCADGRRLGVPLRTLTLFDGLALNIAVPIDHPALADGFHDVERDPAHWWRWTDGDALLPPELYAGTADFLLRVELSDASYFRCWSAPTASSQVSNADLAPGTVDLAAYRSKVA